MRRGSWNAAVPAFLAAAFSVAAAGGARAQAVPYPLDACAALTADLEQRVPLSSSYDVEIQWFREGDLGIKGRQCLIWAAGPARRAKGAKADPGMEDMIRGVKGALAKHGFKKNEMVDRFTRKGKAHRAFALRKDRTTCWTNIEVEAHTPGSPTKPSGGKPAAANPAPRWTLSIQCFKG